MPEAVIVATGRTPIGRANKGSLVECRPDDLSALVLRTVLEQVPQLDPAEVEDVLLGCGQPAGEAGYNVARVAALLAGLDNVPGVTVNRYCSSSLQTIRMAAHAIRAGEGDVFIAAGVETVSRYMHGASDTGPHNEAFATAEERTKARAPAVTEPWSPAGRPARRLHRHGSDGRERGRVREGDPRGDGRVRAALADAGRRVPAERILRARDHPGHPGRRHGRHQGRRTRAGTTLEGLSNLKPVFREGGTVTAGNACPLNDGAAAVIVMSDTKAKALGITPLARIVASGVTGLNPEIMGLGPVDACRQVLARANMTIDDIDLVEINEAFAAQVIPSAKHLGISWDKLNVKGGAIALGHPFGQTGARIMTTLLNALEDTGKTFGLESMCVGGGQGMAMIVERLN